MTVKHVEKKSQSNNKLLCKSSNKWKVAGYIRTSTEPRPLKPRHDTAWTQPKLCSCCQGSSCLAALGIFPQQFRGVGNIQSPWNKFFTYSTQFCKETRHRYLLVIPCPSRAWTCSKLKPVNRIQLDSSSDLPSGLNLQSIDSAPGSF